MQDKNLTCRDCGQEFFAPKGFTNEPVRCPSAAHRGKRAEARAHILGMTARCSPPMVLAVAKALRCLSSPVMIGRFTAPIATLLSVQPGTSAIVGKLEQ